MRKAFHSIAAIAMFSLLCAAQLSFALPPNFQSETILSGLQSPVYAAQLPDGRLLVLEKLGRVVIFDPSTSTPAIQTYLVLPNVEGGAERGLTSIALDPQFETNGFLYIYYTHQPTGRNRVSRFSHLGDTADLDSEFVVWEDNEPWSSCCHYGGGLGFGPDGLLYLTTGEEFDGAQAQDLTRAGGKVIRVAPDGSIPADNPFADGPGGNLDEIWATGLRNPYRAAWDLVEERFYIGEVGGNVNSTAREDIHVGRAGANFGWPDCEGQCSNPSYDDPVFDYGHNSAGGAVTLGFVYRGSQFPSSYQGVLFFTDYVRGFIRYLTFFPDGSLNTDEDFGTGFGPIVHMIEAQDGSIYLVNYAGSVERVFYVSGNQPPSISSVTSSPALPGPAPATVSFTAVASDAENDPLSYEWQFGDGTQAFGASVSHTYTSNGPYTVRLLVSDGNRTTTAAPILVNVGNPPTVSISSPVDGTHFRAGDSIVFAGDAVDPDETIGAASYSWDVRFLHNTHTHPAVTNLQETSGTLVIEDSGHDYTGSTGYEFVLTVTDSDGLEGSASVVVLPDKVNVDISTAPIALPVYLDGIPLTTPVTYDTLIGFRHVVSVATQCVDGTEYVFESWSDGGAQTHTYIVPTTNASLTANFIANGPCSELPTDGLVLHLESENAVVDVGGVVTAWSDLSPNANDLTSTGDPRLLLGALNGQSVIDFDGDGDSMFRDSPVGLPTGVSDRSVFLVVNYQGTGYGGFAWGKNACNQTFGTIVDPGGTLMLQGWCQDFPSSSLGTGEGWLVQSATVGNGSFSHFKDGVLIDERNHQFNTVAEKLVMGAEIDGSPFVDMQVAAVFVYDRELSAAERLQVQNYLQTKYLGNSGEQSPNALDDFASAESGGTASIPVLDNDSDPDGVLDPATLTISTPPANGTATVDPVSGVVNYQHNGSGGPTDNFSYVVSDNSGNVSNVANVTVEIVDLGGLLQNGLALRLESKQGVVASGGIVTTWQDLSGNGNDLFAVGDPQLITTPTGGSAIDFDGVGDMLSRGSGFTGIPTGNTDRTVFALVQYDGTGYGGVSFGDRGCNKTFGLIVDPSGNLMMQGFCRSNDFATTEAGTGAGWIIQSVVLEGGIFSHYKDDQLIDSQTHSFGTVMDDIVVGAEIDGTPKIDMQVSAVLIYNRALNPSELQQVRSYLQQNYLGPPTPQNPIAGDDSATVTAGSAVLIDVLSNDVDPDGLIDPATVSIVQSPSSGTLVVDPINGSVTYTHDGGASLTDSFSYTVQDDQGALSNEANVTLDVVASLPPSAVNDSAFVVQGNSVLIDVLSNDSDPEGAIDSSSVSIVQQPSLGIASVNPTTGEINYQHGGASTQSDTFTYSFSDQAGVVSNTATVTITVGTPDATVQITSPAEGGLLQGPSLTINYTVSGTDYDHLHLSLDGAGHNTIMDLTGTYTFNNVSPGPHTVTATLVTAAHQPVPVASATDTIAIVVTDSIGSPVAIDDELSATAVGSTDLVVLTNDLDIDGSIDPSTLTLQQVPSSGNATVDPVSGTVIYTPNPGTTSDQFSYQVADNSGLISNEAFVDVTVNGLIPLSGLVLHLEADEGVLASGGIVTTWQDLSGNGNDLFAVGDPQLITTPTGGSAIDFDGVGDMLSRGSGFTGIPTGNTDRTVFALVQYDGTGYGGVSFGDRGCNKTFGLIVDPSGNLMMQGFCRSNDFATTEAGTGAGWIIQSVVLEGGIFSHYKDDQLIDSQTHSFGTVMDDIVVGAEIDGTPKIDMQVSAVLIYNRALNPSELQQVRSYLQQNYLGPPTPQNPIAGDDSATVTAGSAVLIDVLSNDVDPDGLIDPATVSIVQSPSSGTLVVDPINGSVTYTHDGGASLTDSFSYTVQDDQGALSNEANVTLDVVASLPPSAVNDSAFVVQGNSVLIDVLSNDSDPEGAIDSSSVSIVQQPSLGIASVNPTTGEINYQHGGASTQSDTFTYSFSDQAGVVSNTATVTITVGTPDATVQITSPAEGGLLQGPSLTINYTVSGTDYDHLHLSLDGAGHNTIMDLTGTYTFNNVSPGPHTVTATLVTAAHQPVPVASATDTIAIVVTDSIGSPVAIDDELSATAVGSTDLVVLTNDLDIDGSIDPSTLTLQQVPSSGNATVDPVSGTVIYTPNPGTTSDQFSYQVADNSGLISNEAFVDVTVNGLIPLSGLVLHLEADEGVLASGGIVTTWQDLSGNGNDLFAVGDPQLITTPTGGSAIDFDGVGDMLSRGSGFTGIPTGNTDRTVFALVQYDGTGYGGVSFGDRGCNKTFGLIVDPSGNLMMQGFCRSKDFATTEAGTGAGWIIQSVVLEGGIFSHYKDDQLIDSQTHSFGTVMDDIVVGAEIDGTPKIDMQVSAVLIYNRALNPSELQQVRDYLAQEFYLP